MNLFGKRVNTKLVAIHSVLALVVFFGFQSFEYYSDKGESNLYTDDPIYLSFLSAEPDESTVGVEWKTHREENTHLFTLERSIDGQIYETVDTILAAGNSRTLKSYAINDKSPELGHNYYRIRQTKTNGTYSFTEPVVVTKTKFVKSKFTIEPTTDTRFFEVHIESYYTDLNLLLFDEKGLLVFNQTINNNKGYVDTRLDFSTVNKPGKYFAKLDAGDDVFVKEIELLK